MVFINKLINCSCLPQCDVPGEKRCLPNFFFLFWMFPSSIAILYLRFQILKHFKGEKKTTFPFLPTHVTTLGLDKLIFDYGWPNVFIFSILQYPYDMVGSCIVLLKTETFTQVLILRGGGNKYILLLIFLKIWISQSNR